MAIFVLIRTCGDPGLTIPWIFSIYSQHTSPVKGQYAGSAGQPLTGRTPLPAPYPSDSIRWSPRQTAGGSAWRGGRRAPGAPSREGASGSDFPFSHTFFFSTTDRPEIPRPLKTVPSVGDGSSIYEIQGHCCHDTADLLFTSACSDIRFYFRQDRLE